MCVRILSVALLVVRAIEEFLLKDLRSHITVRTPTSTAMYVLNHKRSTLSELEARFGLTITIEMDDSVGAQHLAIFRGAIAEKPAASTAVSTGTYVAPEPEEEDEIVEAVEPEVVEAKAEDRPRSPRPDDGEPRGDRKRRKRRRRRGGRDRDHAGPGQHDDQPVAGEAQTSSSQDDDTTDDDGDETAVSAEASDPTPRLMATGRSAAAASAAASATGRTMVIFCLLRRRISDAAVLDGEIGVEAAGAPAEVSGQLGKRMKSQPRKSRPSRSVPHVPASRRLTPWMRCPPTRSSTM